MIEDALEVATDPDYRFELAIQLGKLDIAKVNIGHYINFFAEPFGRLLFMFYAEILCFGLSMLFLVVHFPMFFSTGNCCSGTERV